MTDPLRDILAKALENLAVTWPGVSEYFAFVGPTTAATALLDTLPPDALQAWHDGLALHELRKALPPSWYMKAEWDPDDAPDMTTWYVTTWDQHGHDPIAFGHGDTIAEAADEARGMLEPTP